MRWLACLLTFSLVAQAREWSIQLPVTARAVQAFSPDGSQLLMGDTFGPLLVFNVQTGTVVRSVPMASRRVYSVGWKGKDVLLGDPDAPDAKAVLVLPAKGKRQPRRLPGGVHALAASPSGHYVASISYDTLWMADLRTGKRIRSFEPPFKTWRLSQSNVRGLAWLPNDTLLAVRGGWGVGVPFEVMRVDLRSERPLSSISLPEGFVATCHALDIEHQVLFLGSDDGRLLKVDLAQGTRCLEEKLGDVSIKAMAWNPDGRLALWRENRVELWDEHRGSERRLSPCLEAFAADGMSGWSILLQWVEGDLVLVGQEMNGPWRAERREPKL